MSLPLFALFLTSFGIGTTEFVPIGLLPNIASDLHVSIAQAGLIISSYSIGVTLGSPFVALATTHMSRHRAMLLLISVFIAGNVLTTFAPTFSFLIGARLLTSLCHGAFFGLGAVIAANVVPTKQRARAISIVFAGLTVSNIIGVPLDTAIGQWLGWRTAFGFISLIGILSSIGLYLWIPKNLLAGNISLFSEFRAVMRSQVLVTMFLSVLSSASLFSILTYFTPMLEDVTGVASHAITFYLILFGIGITIGNLLGGKLADWKLMPSLVTIFLLLAVTLGIFAFVIYSVYLTAFFVFLWGMLSFALIAPLQMRVVHEASGAPNLASTLNQAAFHLGNSTGSLIGSVLVSYGVFYQNLIWVGMGLTIFAFIISIYSSKSLPEENILLNQT